MTELSRSLLAAAREGLAPDAAVAARVRAKVAAAVGAGVAATGSLAAIPGKAGTTTAIVVKIGAALLAIGVVTAVVVAARPQRAPEMPGLSVTPREDEVRSEIRVVAPTAPSTDSTESTESTSVLLPGHGKHLTHSLDATSTLPNATPNVANTADTSQAPPPEGPAATTAQRRKGAHDTESDTGESASLAREVELIDLAMVSLKKRAPHAALEAIKAYERETHGRGQMAEDAAAIEIEARCNMDLDATAAIARFDRKWPESAQRERIQTACYAKQ